jgi:hypothetical protein
VQQQNRAWLNEDERKLTANLSIIKVNLEDKGFH